MSKKKFEIILQATGKGINSTFTAATKGMRAFNKEVKSGNNLISSLKGNIAGLAGAYIGFEAFSKVKQIMSDASTAAYTLESSLKAANREFDNVGSAESWAASIDRISKNLKIYSKTEVQNAASRTLDMTKRLGMSADQMERIIALSGDLSAGKTDLVGGIERVTAALRGEAEASEFLGLTLNETYVKAWHEAHNASGTAWKDLTDLEKAQVRYNVFLEQAIPLQGKAGDSITTFAGAVAKAKADINNAFAENDDLIQAVSDLAKIISENSGAISSTASTVATAAGEFLQWAINNRELIATLGKASVLIWGVGKGVNFVYTTMRGLNAASVAMTGSRLIPWLAKVRNGMSLSAIAAGGLAAQLGAVAAAGTALFAGYKVGEWLTMHKAMEGIADSTKNLEQYSGRVSDKLLQISQSTGVIVTSMDELDRAVADGKIHYDDLTATWVNGSAEMATAAKQSATTQKQVTGEALEAMKTKYQQYVDTVKRLQEDLVHREQSVAEKIRAMARTGMTDAGAWRDRKKEAQEYEEAAKKAAEAGNFEKAVEYADKAQAAYEDLNNEVKEGDKVLVSKQEALNTAIDGVKRSAEIAAEAIKAQQEAAAKAMDDLTAKSGFQDLAKGMDESKRKWLDNWEKMRSATMQELEKVEREIVKITTDRHMTIYVDQVVTSSSGGAIGMHLGGLISRAARMAAGGHNIQNALNGFHFPGFGGGDQPKNLVMAENGEVMLNKFSVRAAGLKAALAFNSENWPVVMAELAKRFASKMRLGGMVGRVSMPTMPITTMQAGGQVVASDSGHETTVRLDLGLMPGQRRVTAFARREEARELARQFNMLAAGASS